MTPDRSHLYIDGRRLEVAWHGPGPAARPTLVFLHEGLGCVAMWRGFPEALARACDCGALVYSRAGYGGSDPVPLPRPLRYMHDEGEVVLPALLDAAGVADAVLVGHSDGASIALIFAGTAVGRTRTRVRGLALAAPHVFCEDVSVASVEQAQQAFAAGDLRARLARHHGDNVDVAFHGWAGAWSDPAFRAWNIEAALPGVDVPVLVIQGEDDAYGTLRQVEAVARGCAGPVRTRVLPGCGHSPHRERPAETLAAMTAFVREVLG